MYAHIYERLRLYCVKKKLMIVGREFQGHTFEAVHLIRLAVSSLQDMRAPVHFMLGVRCWPVRLVHCGACPLTLNSWNNRCFAGFEFPVDMDRQIPRLVAASGRRRFH